MRYQFQSEQGNIAFRPRYFTEVIKVLIIVNTIIFLFRVIAKNQLDLAQIFWSFCGDCMAHGLATSNLYVHSC